MAVTHFNAEDTEYNRAIVRKTMIAAVRRARHPGCKFDNILVLEGPEGYFKSMTLAILAGEDNFSDQSILGARDKEVQEQLSEVWIHENADLAGMKKADVEHVKSFASRQTDRARPAFGHFLKKQKRHSIETGTTNSSEYLQSQTGNRRFWLLIVLSPIDIDLMRRDRLQLWGEAAKCESAGESIFLDEKLWPRASEEQEKRRVKDPWESIVANLPERISILNAEGKEERSIKIIHREDGLEKVISSDLLTYLMRIPVGQQEVRHRCGWQM
jgi:predicted P-loop ATPase